MTRSRISMLLIGALALTLVLAAAAAACSGKKEEPKPAATATATSAATAAPEQGAGAPLGAGNVVAALCGNWAGVTASARSMAGPPAGAATDMRTTMTNLDQSLKTMVASAPAEIRPDFQVMAKYWGDFAAIMTKANFDLMKAAQDPDFVKLAEGSATADVEKASKNIDAWVAKNCR